MPFDADAVRALATILADTGLTEIEIESKDGRIRVARAPAPVAPLPATTVQVSAPAGPPPAPAAPPLPPDDAHHPGAIRSPMVGVAYLAPDPQATPFVTVGQAVTAGQTLLLIEAMKTYNQIKAPRGGTVTRILVATGTPVEYDEPLLILE
jgi:acetyl-CoA carboxylase biotin carboxyl carrier protein